jgi:Fe-S cluster assembly protein SufD
MQEKYRQKKAINELIESLLRQEARYLLVFVDGIFVTELSDIDDLPFAFCEITKTHDLDGLQESKASHGAYLEIAAGVNLARPIHLLFITTKKGNYNIANVINVDAHGKGKIIEEYVSLSRVLYMQRIFTQLTVKQHAQVDYKKLSRLTKKATQVSDFKIAQEEGSIAQINYGAISGKVQEHLNVQLEGINAHNKIYGWGEINAREQLALEVIVEHLSSQAVSDTLFKYVVRDDGIGSFVGKIAVPKGIKQSNARLYNKNLLLGEKAVVHTAPALEIYADDVAASHGATVGKLDEGALFYLQTRGFSFNGAVEFLTHAFLAEVRDYRHHDLGSINLWL